jgi:hypothetical protein
MSTMVHRTKDHIICMQIQTLDALSMNVGTVRRSQDIVQSGTTHITGKYAHSQGKISQ